MNLYLQKVKDFFAINKRIKSINPSYELFFNTKEKRYEVHDMSKNYFHSLCLTVAKNDLNASILQKLLMTKRENMIRLFKSIDEDNRRLEDQKLQKISGDFRDCLTEVLGFAERENKDLSLSQIQNVVSTFKNI